ncbi:MAG: hypothetical protein OHK0029_34000 [Armatimonadaceae bacterium]
MLPVSYSESMKNPELVFRQIHLDFHTSPDIPEIAADFDPEEFAQTLERAHVNSVTCFARCHHGMIYFDSQKHPERVHPHLKNRNLLREQIEACHKRGIRVPIYVTVQWDDFTADEHRDWLCVDASGREYDTAPLAPGFYRFLDVFHPGYRQFLFDHIDEVLTSLPTDGLFLDIVQARPSLAKYWLDAMDNAGVNPEDEGERQRFAQTVIRDWEHEMTEFIRSRNSDCTIFYNSGHVGPRHRLSQEAYSHYELESLPSGGWGYLHFPQAMRYARVLGKDCLGMTGKFHTSWGDFGSYKNPAALQFECFHMLALGAKCSIGDQLPPRGSLDSATYELVGQVYAEVAQKEPWCKNTVPVAEVGVLTPEEFVDQRPAFNAKSERDVPSVLGAVRMLQELQYQFDILDSRCDLSNYKVLILPDDLPVSDTVAAKLRAYVQNGGKLLASHRSGLNPTGAGFHSEFTDLFGVRYVGAAPFSPDFLVPGAELIALDGAGGRDAAHVMYLAGTQVTAGTDAAILATVQKPYFNRTWRHYCSHRHTPSAQEDAGYPGITQKDNCAYFMHPVFTQYFDCAPLWCKTLVGAVLKRLLPQRLVTVEGPSSIIAALNHQPSENRYVLHLLHYIPERRGTAFDVIEDVIPLHQLTIRLHLPDGVSNAELVPEGTMLPVERNEDGLTLTLPTLNGHAMIALS